MHHRYINQFSVFSQALVSGPTSKMPVPEGGLYSGQPLMMCSVVCSPHTDATLSASPHFMDDLYRPTPVRFL